MKIVAVTRRGDDFDVREVTSGFGGGMVHFVWPRPFPADPHEYAFGPADVEAIGLVDDGFEVPFVDGKPKIYTEEVFLGLGESGPITGQVLRHGARPAQVQTRESILDSMRPKPAKPKTTKGK